MDVREGRGIGGGGEREGDEEGEGRGQERKEPRVTGKKGGEKVGEGGKGEGEERRRWSGSSWGSGKTFVSTSDDGESPGAQDVLYGIPRNPKLLVSLTTHPDHYPDYRLN